MKILGIETSCDETAVAVVADGTTILSNVVASQVELHARYGGIVPEVASRQHLLTILPVLKQAMREADITFKDLNGVAVTIGPGLPGSLLVGVNLAKAIALAQGLPLIRVNHLEGHIYANWLERRESPLFPCLCLIVSGGHTDLVLMEEHGQFKKIGQTRDDAAGEAFDKGARILGLSYPGGPIIEKIAKEGKPSLALPRAWLKGNNDFSFSGLKTALFHLVQGKETADFTVADAAASFQQAVIDVLVTKTIDAAKRLRVRQILLSGGVAANRSLCQHFVNSAPIPVLFSPPKLCTDNAAMIASCGYYHFKMGKVASYDFDVIPSLRLGV